MIDQNIGILLINVGTPDAPKEDAVRMFLAEFLSDPLVVDYPRWFWMPVLNRIILTKRPARSAKKYNKIWTEDGSPLLFFTESIASKIKTASPGWVVKAGMRYGTPSISQALADLKKEGATHLIVLPLYPQYSSTTSLSAIQKTRTEMAVGLGFKSTTIIEDYFDHPSYIAALANSIQAAFTSEGKPDAILFSYHGVPKRLVTKHGEPYLEQCQETTRLAAEHAKSGEIKIGTSFQSKFGPEIWLGPSTKESLTTLAEDGIKKVFIIAPGFAADCLETLEEISIEDQEIFLKAGGEEFHYIPALNDNDYHVQALIQIIEDILPS